MMASSRMTIFKGTKSHLAIVTNGLDRYINFAKSTRQGRQMILATIVVEDYLPLDSMPTMRALNISASVSADNFNTFNPVPNVPSSLTFSIPTGASQEGKNFDHDTPLLQQRVVSDAGLTFCLFEVPISAVVGCGNSGNYISQINKLVP